jgi:hypothetical protein
MRRCSPVQSRNVSQQLFPGEVEEPEDLSFTLKADCVRTAIIPVRDDERGHQTLAG